MLAIIYDFGEWTPELDGAFQDLKLKLKPFLQKEKQVFMQKLMRELGLTELNAMEPRWQEKLTAKLTSLIIDWENMNDEKGVKVPCTPENIAKYLLPIFEEKTGIEFKTKEERKEKVFYTLSGYIDHFSGTIANYTKNSRSTATSGSSGGVPGPGKNLNTLN